MEIRPVGEVRTDGQTDRHMDDHNEGIRRFLRLYKLTHCSERNAYDLETNVTNTLRTGAFKLFKFTSPGSKQFKSTFIMCFLNIYNKFPNYFCELKVSGNIHQRP